jgi:hypothetical protein
MRIAAGAPGDAEQSVLAALLRAPGRVATALEVVSSDDFSTPGRAALFATLAAVVEAARGEDVSAEDVAGQLEALRGADDAGRAAEIAAEALETMAALLEAPPPPPTDERLRFDLRRVREMADVRRALREAAAPPPAEAEPDLPGGGGGGGGGGAPPWALREPAASGAPDAPRDPLNLEGKLRLLQHLARQGLITDEEYADKRRRLLDTL